MRRQSTVAFLKVHESDYGLVRVLFADLTQRPKDTKFRAYYRRYIWDWIWPVAVGCAGRGGIAYTPIDPRHLMQVDRGPLRLDSGLLMAMSVLGQLPLLAAWPW